MANWKRQTVWAVRDGLNALLYHYDDREYLNWHFRQSSRLRAFKDMHQGETCFIIGNGPSLNQMDLTTLKDYHTFGLNKIYLMFDRVNLNLSYHVSVNDLVIEKSASEFEALLCPSFLAYRPAYKHVKPLSHINFLMFSKGMSFQTELTKPLCQGYTVTYVALQIAYYMGFSTVFLIGVDHHFKVDGNPNERQHLQGVDQNHFDPSYFGNMEWQLPEIEGSELAYNIAKFVFERSGRRICDATVGGKLRIFPKIPYEQALQQSSRK